MKQKFASGDKVFAKVRGYPPWPARIEGFADETPNKERYHVYFYGTGETAVIKAEEICSFVENKAKLGKPKKHKYFTEALIQIEAELPPEQLQLANELVEKQAALEKNAAELDESATGTDDPSKNASRRSSTSGKQKQTPSGTPTVAKAKDKKRKVDAEISDDSEVKKSRSSAINVTEADTTSAKTSPEVMSRSGRKIKPKRFADFEDAANEELAKSIKPAGKPKLPETEIGKQSDLPEDYIVAVVNDTEQVKIPLKLNRPNFSDDPKSAEIWDDMVLKYASSLKKRLELGEEIVDIHDLMNEWTAVKSFQFVKDKVTEEDKQRFDSLQIESQLLEIDINIKSSLNLQKAQPEKCLAILEKLNELKITPLMLKKHPELVHTIKKLRNYVGNLHRWEMTQDESDAFKEQASRIRLKSDHIYNKFKSLFLNQNTSNFLDFFNKEVERFQEKTKNMSLHQVFMIIQEPE